MFAINSLDPHITAVNHFNQIYVGWKIILF